MTIHTRLNTIELPRYTRAAEVRAQSFDADAYTVDVIWTTGATVRRTSFRDGPYNEELVVTPATVRLDRLNAGAPFLNSHDGFDVRSVIGAVVPGSARISNGAGLATIQLSRRQEAAGIVGDIRDGVIRNVSVGYRYHRIEKTEAANGQLPLWRVVDWEPLELSAVAVGADIGAQVRSDSAETFPCAVTAAPALPALSAEGLAAIGREAVRSERERVNAIGALGRQHHETEFANEHIRAGTSVDAFRALLEAKRMRVHVLRDQAETRARGMTDAIATTMAHAVGERVDVPSHARPYMGRGLVELMAESIGWRGRLLSTRDLVEVFERAFHATSDFPAIFSDSINARLLARYQTAPATYRTFCGRLTAADLRATNVVRAGDFPSLQPINQVGEIKGGTFSASKEAFQVHPYGVTFNLSRTMIINDNLSAIAQMLAGAGDRVIAWENALAFALLLSGSGAGPTLLTDNTAVFHVDHGNLAGSPSAIDLTNVGLGRAAMAKQQSQDGLSLNLAPATLLCGRDKALQAAQLVTTITPAQTSNAVPEALRLLTPVSDANITGNAWYLFADPAAAPCFHYGYLEGYEAPRLSIVDAWSVQGVKVKLEHDFGVAATDFRGGYRNAGA